MKSRSSRSNKAARPPKRKMGSSRGKAEPYKYPRSNKTWCLLKTPG